MLLGHHLSYTDQALAVVSLGAADAEIHIGSTVNDLCEFTNEANLFLPDKQSIRGFMGNKRSLLGSSVIYRSHFGDLTCLHAMAGKVGEAASTTLKRMGAWFDALQALATGTSRLRPTRPLGEQDSSLQRFFDGTSSTLADVMDTRQPDQIRARALGMMLHLIQDSWTPSHCERAQDGGILAFLCYTAQASDRHQAGDDVLPRHREAMMAACVACLQAVREGRVFDWRATFPLHPEVRPSDSGCFAA